MNLKLPWTVEQAGERTTYKIINNEADVIVSTPYFNVVKQVMRLPSLFNFIIVVRAYRRECLKQKKDENKILELRNIMFDHLKEFEDL